MLSRSLTSVLIAFSVLFINASAAAQSDDEIEQAIVGAMAALDEFMLSFNARDPQAWAASLNYPHVRFASGGVTVWQSAEEFAQTRAFESLSRLGWDHSHWLSRDVTLASPDKVHVATVFQRFNSDNQPIATYQSLYLSPMLMDTGEHRQDPV